LKVGYKEHELAFRIHHSRDIEDIFSKVDRWVREDPLLEALA